MIFRKILNTLDLDLLIRRGGGGEVNKEGAQRMLANKIMGAPSEVISSTK